VSYTLFGKANGIHQKLLRESAIVRQALPRDIHTIKTMEWYLNRLAGIIDKAGNQGL